jgi:group I intron endonuclease
MYTIYLITNTLNGHRYIGFTTKTPEKRWASHQNRSRRKDPKHKYRFHHAITKYGPENFSLSILKQGADHVEGLTVEEPRYIKALNPEYNLAEGGRGSTGYTRRPLTAAHKALLSKVKSGVCTPSMLAAAKRSKGQPRKSSGPLTAEHRARVAAGVKAARARLGALWAIALRSH